MPIVTSPWMFELTALPILPSGLYSLCAQTDLYLHQWQDEKDNRGTQVSADVLTWVWIEKSFAL